MACMQMSRCEAEKMKCNNSSQGYASGYKEQVHKASGYAVNQPVNIGGNKPAGCAPNQVGYKHSSQSSHSSGYQGLVEKASAFLGHCGSHHGSGHHGHDSLSSGHHGHISHGSGHQGHASHGSGYHGHASHSSGHHDHASHGSDHHGQVIQSSGHKGCASQSSGHHGSSHHRHSSHHESCEVKKEEFRVCKSESGHGKSEKIIKKKSSKKCKDDSSDSESDDEGYGKKC